MFDAAGQPLTGAARDEFLAQHGPEARGVATRGDLSLDNAVIEASPKLEIVSVYGVGYDGVDIGLAKARGVRVANTPGVLDEDVADLALQLWLTLMRDGVRADAWARSGDWAAKGAYPLQRRAHGGVAGVLGLGRIGKAIARRLEGFGMTILYQARSEKPDSAYEFVADPVELARRADCLFVACVSNAETRHIVSKEVIAALGPEGALINISRAATVDEDALLTALETGALGGAGLDVFEGEPALNPRFAPLGNVVMQPHQGSATVATRKAMGQLMRDNLARQFAGEPLLTPVV